SSRRDLETAADFLERAAGLLSAQPMTPSLYGGITGVAWATEHLRARLFDADEDDSNEEIDVALLDHLNQSPWRGPYDLVYGLIGVGVYALERTPRPGAVACLERVIDRLEEVAVRGPEGIAWFTPPRHLPVTLRERSPDGHFNLGLAHGVPGAVAFLAEACRRNVGRE